MARIVGRFIHLDVSSGTVSPRYHTTCCRIAWVQPLTEAAFTIYIATRLSDPRKSPKVQAD